MKYELYEMMFNGSLHNWKVKDFFTTEVETGTQKERKFHSLIAKSFPTNTSTEIVKPKVIFQNNRAVQSSDSEIVSGGAIADNGLLEIGTTSEIRIVKVWEDKNPYGITTRPPAYDLDDVYSLLNHLVLIKNNRNGTGETLGTLDMIKADDNEITVDIYTGNDAKKQSPYSSNVVHEENSVIDKIYDSTHNEWIIPDGTYWLIDVKGLPGNPYGYTIEENEILGYRPNELYTKGLVLTNTLETTKLKITKQWDDPGHSDKRPGSVAIRLYADGVEVACRQLTGPDWETEWETEFDNLPRYQEGKRTPIEYTVTEDQVKDYTSEPSGNEAVKFIKNTYAPGKTTVYVTKKWEDAHTQDGMRPSSVTVHLLRNGKDTGMKLVLSQDNYWTGTFNNLDENGTYSIREDSIPNYTVSVSGDQKKGFVITNTHETQLTQVTATKKWSPGENPPEKPTQVTFRLHANDVEIRRQTVSADNGWRVTFDRLPKYNGSKEITYTITEDHVPNYTTVIDLDSLEVTNTYNPGKTDVYVLKTWEDDNDLYKIRPEQVTVRLYANGVNTGKQLVLNEANKWYGFFGNLNERDGNDKKIDYTVVEDPVEGYISFVTGNAEKGYTIGNAWIPVHDQHFRFTKVWIGGNGNEISWNFYSEEGKQLNQRFKRKKLSDSQWLYESANNVDRGDYLIENPVPGYIIQYENVGAHANITDRLYNGGRILNVRLPQTGDKEKPWIFITLGALSILGILFLLRRHRKQRTKT
ncbi:MAG: Cna B-type domain-containing protein [Clostridia bacterium]|nr:Cna B-type domain-containing protein [Clostridia bacterium]